MNQRAHVSSATEICVLILFICKPALLLQTVQGFFQLNAICFRLKHKPTYETYSLCPIYNEPNTNAHCDKNASWRKDGNHVKNRGFRCNVFESTLRTFLGPAGLER